MLSVSVIKRGDHILGKIPYLTTLFCNGEIASEDFVQFVKETEYEIGGTASLI
jgi:hypothetical protein